MIDFIDKMWLRKNKVFRLLLSFLFLIIAVYVFIYSRNIFLGTVFLFLVAYFLGSFKRRNNVIIINNKDIPTAIREIKKLLDLSKESVEILTLSLNPVIYSNEDVLDSFRNAIARHVKIVVACNYKEFKKKYTEYYRVNKTSGFLKFFINNNIALYDVHKNLQDINHFIVVDYNSFRLEETHESDTEQGRKATIVYFSTIAKELHNDFNTIISKQDLCSRVNTTEIESILNPQ
jgi:hypothetical protein